MFEKEGFSSWFKENTPKEGFTDNTTFTIQFLIDAWNNGYNKAKEDADKMKSRFLELCNLKDMRIKELEKANEWHYIKDGNLPKENENVLIYSNRANHIGFYRNGFWFTNSDGCLEDDDIEVIAWKEIVLPELPKESE